MIDTYVTGLKCYGDRAGPGSWQMTRIFLRVQTRSQAAHPLRQALRRDPSPLLGALQSCLPSGHGQVCEQCDQAP